jgi:hypothetical protein
LILISTGKQGERGEKGAMGAKGCSGTTFGKFVRKAELIFLKESNLKPVFFTIPSTSFIPLEFSLPGVQRRKSCCPVL